MCRYAITIGLKITKVIKIENLLILHFKNSPLPTKNDFTPLPISKKTLEIYLSSTLSPDETKLHPYIDFLILKQNSLGNKILLTIVQISFLLTTKKSIKSVISPMIFYLCLKSRVLKVKYISKDLLLPYNSTWFKLYERQKKCYFQK